jgi:hypothetical protein
MARLFHDLVGGVASKSKPIAAVRLIGLFLCTLAQTAFGLAA